MIDTNTRFSLTSPLEDGRFWRLIEHVGSHTYMVLTLKKKENFQLSLDTDQEINSTATKY